MAMCLPIKFIFLAYFAVIWYQKWLVLYLTTDEKDGL